MDSLTEVEARLVASLADILDVPPQAIALDAALADLGVDSIVAVQWVRALKAHHGIGHATLQIETGSDGVAPSACDHAM